MDTQSDPAEQGSDRTKRQVGDQVQASVARCLRTPPYAARRKDLSFDLRHRLRGDCDRSMVVICNYTLRTDNGGISPSEGYIFRRPSILFRPRPPCK